MKKVKQTLGLSVIMLTMLFSNVNITNANELGPGGLEGDGIVCKCNLFGHCKADGGQEKCASFEGNGYCSDYDANCTVG
ncbi:hypothetical protein KCTC32516_00580 [Polaribacter huanghezhanensis]|uniref:hypothetical protein n=1 Tax=Polaribacter huanghezhanensis TaxID=1354726 RepID=UPI00264732BB|nr:hypothetical protein [Polaribacter huanghezhanensis]WKD85240.1 hypothetical protein KCTC32516_00580 [Polaribacter huanghezhanensis]